jgi:ribonuclease P/MRP protein subunit POP1
MYYPLSSGGNPRFGGLKEQQQLAFEAGEPWFPGDFPGTRAGWKWGLREREAAKKEWERRPKGRRVEFDSLDLRNGQKGEIGHGWACDWEKLVKSGNDPSTEDTTTEKGKASESEDASTETRKDEAEPRLNIHQLPYPQANLAVNGKSSPEASEAALATVKLTLHSRGHPIPRARIYRLPSNNPDLRQTWISLATKSPRSGALGEAVSKPQRNMNADDVDVSRQRLAASLLSRTESSSHQDHLPLPLEDDLIGFVTTGNFNLSEGKGTGIGSILVSKVRDTAKGPKRKSKERNMCIVRNAGETVGRLASWELV